VRRYARGAVIGAALALAVEIALLLSGGRFFGYEPLGDVFDAQARSLLDGRWDVPPDVIKIEGFLIDGKTYTYFGPVPAVLRIPIVALVDGMDGRLSRAALLAAWVVTLVAAAVIGWRARCAVAPDRPFGGVDEVLTATWIFALGAGSAVTYLASRPSVFHEAIAWGVALALVALCAVFAYRDRRTAVRFVVAIVAITAALLARASVGAAPAAALGFMLLGDAIAGLRRRDARAVMGATALAAALLVPFAAYAAVNSARFGTLFTLPYDRHIVSMVDEHRQEVLDANHGTIQGPHFLPTTALHYVRPDALGLDASFPWIDFPEPAVVVGDVVMDQIDVASSVPASMPLLATAALVGGVVLARRRRVRDAGFVAAVAGCATCLVVTLSIGFIAQRYTADAVPLLLVAGAPAIPAVAGRLSRRAPGRAIAAVVAGVALALASTAITAALTIQFQQHYGFLTRPSLRADLAARQLDLPTLGAGPTVVRAADSLPDEVAPDRTFVVVGACDGLYRSDGTAWQPVERTPAVGAYELRVVVPAGGIRLVAGVAVERRGREAVVVHGDRRSRPFALSYDDDVVLHVVADRLLGFVEVRRNGELLLDDFLVGPDAGRPLEESSNVLSLPVQTPVCDALVALEDGRSS